VPDVLPARAGLDLLLCLPGAGYRRSYWHPAFGEDYSFSRFFTDPWGEPAYFRGSKDVTLHILDGSAHCHNLAGSRRDYWVRLDRWIDSLRP